MDICDIRRTNARLLMDGFKNLSAFSDKIDRTPAYVSRIVGANPTKNIGHSMARHIESAFSKTRGWLDNPHNDITSEGVDKEAGIALEFEKLLTKKLHFFHGLCSEMGTL